ncbi:MAG: ABC transporter ATP-binding protein [Lachnospiraceae bacterium]|nr:ABC transporter ATP-binding protein [Lachnospiraceae bacterium]
MKVTMNSEFTYLKIIRKFWKHNLICFILLIMYSFLNILYPYFVQQLIDLGIGNMSVHNVFYFATMMIVTIMLSIMTGYIMKMNYIRLGQKISLYIREKILRGFDNYSLGFFQKNKTGDIVSVLDNDVRNVQTLYAYIISDFASNIFIFVGISYTMLKIDLFVTLLIIILICIFSVFHKNMGAGLKKSSSELSCARGDLQSFEHEFFNNYYEIKNLNGIRYFDKKLLKYQKKLIEMELRNAKIKAFSTQYGFMFQNLCLVIAFIYGGVNVMEGKLTVGTLFSMIMYIQKLFSPVRSLFDLYMEIKKNQASVQRIDTLINQNQYYCDFGNEEFPVKHHDIAIDNLSFAYEEKNIFYNFRFRIEKGDKIALLGSNGKGKTTLTKFLLRSVAGYQGEIRIDTVNSVNISDRCYRKHVVGLSQKVVIFSGTIYENVTLYDYSVKKEDVKKALEKVGFYNEIERLPLGIDTLLGGNGINLSGGQEQKIHLARLYVLNPDVIILDEPTSAIDDKSESIIYDNLFLHFSDKTILVISHKKEVLKYCNKIIDLDQLDYGCKQVV